MKLNLSPLEFNTVLESIARQWCLSKDAREQFISLGINSSSWPQISAKSLITEFELMVKLKDYDWAKAMLGEKALELLDSNLLPEDLNEIKIQYHQNLKSFMAKNFAHEILKNPDKADELVNQYLSNKPMGVQLYNISEQIGNAVAENEKRVAEKKNVVILPDFPILSQQIGGFNPKRVSLLSAVSGFGKTKIAINFALSASKIMPVLYYNMEMGVEDFVGLFIHKECNIQNTDWYNGSYLTAFNLEKIHGAIKTLEQRNIKCTDGRSLTIDQIAASILGSARQNEKTFIIVDYDQKIATRDYEQEWMGILRAVERLEDVAKETNSQILILVQADDSGNGNPKASKRSKQPASVVLNFTQDEDQNYIVRSIKNRFGSNNFEVRMDYDPATTTVKELSLHQKQREPTAEEKASRKMDQIMGRR